ncbi:MAG: electron transfer flavoprotein subunit beta/FixA family protein [Fusobacteriaceae bacterium]|jgi:electron transfer flavoprotein beta subunit|nr:electron transfer flavoprotein subunit beta/FixA family protein [Fusobacteriaceae bacterium]
MTIFVFIKQVPENNKITIDRTTGNLVREGVPAVMNAPDRNAVELAVSLKERLGGTVTLFTMGLPQAKDILTEGIAMGADRGILLTDRAFGGADTLATAEVLAGAARHYGPFDLILCGSQSSDGSTGQIAAKLAELLDLPALTFADGFSLTENTVVIKRRIGLFTETVESTLPLVASLTTKVNEPREAGTAAKFKAKKVLLEEVGNALLQLQPERIGAAGSPTKVAGSFATPERKKGISIKGANAREMGQNLVRELLAEKLI